MSCEVTARTWREGGGGGGGGWAAGCCRRSWFLFPPVQENQPDPVGCFCLSQFLVVCNTMTTSKTTTATTTSLQRNQTMWHRGETEWDEAFAWLRVNRINIHLFKKSSWFHTAEGLFTSEILFCCYLYSTLWQPLRLSFLASLYMRLHLKPRLRTWLKKKRFSLN